MRELGRYSLTENTGNLLVCSQGSYFSINMTHKYTQVIWTTTRFCHEGVNLKYIIFLI